MLPALNPTAEPARSDGFSAEWECRWTSEKEINFARETGLFGQKWKRTYQPGIFWGGVGNTFRANTVSFGPHNGFLGGGEGGVGGQGLSWRA